MVATLPIYSCTLVLGIGMQMQLLSSEMVSRLSLNSLESYDELVLRSLAKHYGIIHTIAIELIIDELNIVRVNMGDAASP
jgi:hypothetical protein